jgi:cell division transport system permease protein
MMARIQQTLYFVREALVNMNRNRVTNGLVVGMIAISLAIFGMFWLIYSNLHAVARRWTNEVQIIAYLRDGLSDEQRLSVDAAIRTIEGVADLTYVSAAEALTQFTARLGDQAFLLEGLGANPLPASYEIRLHRKHRKLSSVRQVVEALKGISAIEDLHYGEQWLQNLTAMIRLLEFIGVFLGVFLFLTVIFTISNTIKLTLYSREEEITIMKFIGATERFIKGPFLAEGVIRGFLGAVLSLALLFGLYKLFVATMTYSSQTLLAFARIGFLPWTAIISMALLGSFLGWCGSLLTLHKFLKTY